MARSGLALGQMFRALEAQKALGAAGLGVEEYTISQTTLEQVFLSIAKAQVDPEGAAVEPESAEGAGEVAPAAGTVSVLSVAVVPPSGEPEPEPEAWAVETVLYE